MDVFCDTAFLCPLGGRLLHLLHVDTAVFTKDQQRLFAVLTVTVATSTPCNLPLIAVSNLDEGLHPPQASLHADVCAVWGYKGQIVLEEWSSVRLMP